MSSSSDLSFLEHENNPDILRELVKIAMKHTEKLEKLLAETLAERERQKQIKLNLDTSYAILQREYFGRGREKADRAKNRARREASQEVLIHSERLAPKPKDEDVKKLEHRKCYHTTTPEELDEALRRREPSLPPDFKAQWKELANFTEDSKELTIIERRYVILEHERQKYKTLVTLPTGEEKEVIIAAPGPTKLLPGSSYSIDFAVSVVGDKYLMHLPLERQRRDMVRLGLAGIEVKTLWNLSWTVGEHLKPVAEKIRAEILNPKYCVHADETPWPIQGKKDDDGYMWSISNMAGAFYAFEPTRSGKIIEEMLDGFEGAVMSDGYLGYGILKKNPKLQLSNCWAHVRRKFFQIDKAKPGGPSVEIIDMIDDLFEIERAGKTFEELFKLRLEKSVPLVEKIKVWLEDNLMRNLSQSPMRTAIRYPLKIWSGLTLFLQDVRVPMSNNDAERTLRHAVVGRKNFYGSKTINGADLAATLYTVIETCKRVELEPRDFIAMAVRMSAEGGEPPTPLEYARSIRAAAYVVVNTW